MAQLDSKFCFAMLLCFCFFAPVCSITFNAIVSLDGSGDYKTVGAAITAAPDNSNSRFYIHVKPGTYRERVVIPSTKKFIALIGDNAFTTIIVDNRSNGAGFQTSDSATFTVHGNNFMAQSLTFENSAGPQNHQAVAILDHADNTAYYKCRFLGFQDTLYAKGKYQFFKECDIFGSVDFIFGQGLAMFQDCNIYGRIPNKSMTVTAQSKEKSETLSGFSFQNCTVTASPDIAWNKQNVQVYLGRPWSQYSSVVFMESFLDEVVAPAGWLEWEGVPVNNLFYAEFNNRGRGADVSKRIHWSGFHVLGKELAVHYTVENFIHGFEWLPETGIPFRRGLFFGSKCYYNLDP